MADGATNGGTILQRALTITAKNATKTYDGQTWSGGNGLNYSGFATGEDAAVLGGALAWGGTAQGTRHAGSYSLTASGYASSNYQLNYTPGTLTVNQAALTLAAVTDSKVYNGNQTSTGTVVMSGLLGNDTISNVNQAFTSQNALGAGNSTLAVVSGPSGFAINDGNSGANYSVALQTASGTITPRTLGVSGLAANSRAYNGSTDATSDISNWGSVSTGIAGEYLTLNHGSANFDTANAGYGKTVTASGYSLADGTGGLAGNYLLAATTATTTAAVGKAAISLTTIDVSKTYDGDTSALGTATVVSGTLYANASHGGVLDSISGGNFAFTSKNAGTGNKTVTVAGVTVSDGNDGGNYVVTYVNNTISTIQKAALTISGITAADKVYDGNSTATASTTGLTAPALQAGGMVANDDISVVATGHFRNAGNTANDKNVGIAKTVLLSSSYSGADVDNYTITDQATTTASITHKALTISGITAASKEYNGNSLATISTAGMTSAALQAGGMVAGDVVTVAATGHFRNAGNTANDKNMGTGKTVLLISSYDGADVGNYSITDQATTTASITPKALTITGITASSKVYDGTSEATVSNAGVTSVALQTGGMVIGDDVTVTATGHFRNAFNTTNDRNAATGKTVLLSSSYGGTDVGNYTITDQATTIANITPKVLTISGLSSSTKAYDATHIAAVLGSAAFATEALGSGTYNDGKAYVGDSIQLSGTAIGSFNSKDVVSANRVSFSGLSLAGAQTGNYTLTAHTDDTSARITPKALTISANNDARFVSQTDAAGYAGVNYSGFVNGETPGVLSGTLALSRSNAGTNAVGVYSGELQVGGLTASNYSIHYVNGDYSIVGANQLLVKVSNLSNTYGTLPQYSLDSVAYFDGSQVVRLDNGSLIGSQVLVTPSNQVLVNDGASGMTSFTLTPLAGVISGAGKLAVGSYQLGTSGVVTGNSQSFGNDITVVGNQQVTPKAVTASASGVSKVYDGSTAVTSSSLSLTGKESGDALSVSGVGSYSNKNAGSSLGYSFSNVVLSGADGSNYYLPGSNTFSGSNGSITPKTVTLSASKTYDGSTNLSGSQLTIGALINSETLGYNGATASDSHVATPGKYVSAIALTNATDGSGGLASNYQLPTLDAANAALTINPKMLLPTLSNTSVSKVYDGTTNAPTGFAPTYSFTGLVSGDTAVSLSHASALYNNANVANANTLTLSGMRIGAITGTNGSAASDYVLDATSKSVGASITQATLTVTANNDARFASQTDTTNYAGVGYSGFVNGETATTAGVLGGTATVLRNSAGTNTAPATYTGVLQVLGLSADNYALNYVNGDYTIVGSNQLLVRVASVSNTYGSATPYALSSVQYEAGGTIYSLGMGGVSGSSRSINASNLVQVNDGASGTASFTLAPVAGVMSGAGKLAVGAWQLGTSGTVTENSSNFGSTVTVVGSHQVNAKAVTAAASAVSKVYDGNTTVTNGTRVLTDKESGDVLDIGGIGSYSAKNVGTTGYGYANVNLSGADAGNYYLSGGNSFAGNDGVISAKTLTASYTANNKVYDRSNNATVSGSSGDIVTGDVVTFASTTATFADKNVGNGKAVMVGGISIDGTEAGNYALQNTTAITTANITAKAVTVSGITAANKVYDGQTTAVVNASQASGWIDGDQILVSATGLFDDKNVNTGKTVALISNYGGNDLGNYAITDQAATTAAITAKAVSLNLGSVTKVYDGQTTYNTNASELLTLAGQLAVSSDTVSAALLNYGDKNVGTGKNAMMTAVSIDDGNGGRNYVVTLGTNSSSTITRLNAATWTGGATGNWFDARNWSGGAVPDLANVANVVIPAGSTVSFDTAGAVFPAISTQPVQIDSLGNSGALNQSNSRLEVSHGVTLSGLVQSGGTLTVGADLALNGSVVQSGNGRVRVQGSTSITAPGQSVTLGNVDNDFVGSVTVNAGTTSLRDSNALTAVLSTTGNTTLQAGDGLVVSGTVSGTGSNLLASARQLAFGTTTVDGNLVSKTMGNATIGGVSQTGELVVKGNADFVADTGANQTSNLTLSNDFQGVVSYTKANGGSWRLVKVTDRNNFTLGNFDIDGDLHLDADGDIVQDHTNGKKIVVGGGTRLKAKRKIKLDGKDNKFTKGVTVLALSYSIVGDSRKDAEEAQGKAVAGVQLASLPGTGVFNATPPQALVMTSGAAPGSSSGTAASASNANSTGVTVDLQNTSQQDSPLMVAVSLPKGASTVGTGFSFEMPASVKGMAGADAEILISQADGSPLPAWLKFDQLAMRFESTAVPDSALPMQLVVALAGRRVTVVISERTE